MAEIEPMSGLHEMKGISPKVCGEYTDPCAKNILHFMIRGEQNQYR